MTTFGEWLKKIKVVSRDPFVMRCNWCGETFIVQLDQDTAGAHALSHLKGFKA